ncbi:MAG: cation diffusion facilitator family transporter, partial [Candidatus Heimdallarchaeaceae archaeon]
KPADRDHPFGHGKFQFLLSLAIVVFMIFSSYQIAEEAISRLINQDFLVFEWIILIVALTSIVGKFFLSYVLFVIGKKLNSPSILSLSKNFRSDVIASFLVVGAIIGAYFEVYWLDPVLALLIVVIIILTGYDIAKDSLPILLDRGPPEDIVKLIEEKGLECEHVEEVHFVRLRRIYDQWTGDFHLLVDEDMIVKDAHTIAEKLKKKLEDTGVFKDIVIHIEPYNSEESLKR